MHEKIYELASAALSPAESEQVMLDTLCSAAEVELTTALRSGITAEDCSTTFILSAAMIAMAEMMIVRGASGEESFTAGDVSIRRTSGKDSSSAAALRQQAKALMAPYCMDSGFSFMGVQG